MEIIGKCSLLSWPCFIYSNIQTNSMQPVLKPYKFILKAKYIFSILYAVYIILFFQLHRNFIKILSVLFLIKECKICKYYFSLWSHSVCLQMQIEIHLIIIMSSVWRSSVFFYMYFLNEAFYVEADIFIPILLNRKLKNWGYAINTILLTQWEHESLFILTLSFQVQCCVLLSKL